MSRGEGRFLCLDCKNYVHLKSTRHHENGNPVILEIRACGVASISQTMIAHNVALETITTCNTFSKKGI